MKLHELREKRAAAVTEMRGLADKADTETRDLSTDEDKRFGELKTEIAGLDKKIERAETLATAERAAPAILVNGHGDGSYEQRAGQFSITKAITASLPAELGGSTVDAGFEREMSQEVARRSGRKFEGIAVPDEAFLAERRTLTTSAGAADLIPNVHRGDLLIDRLRASLITGRLGATVMDGLVGTVDIPRQTGSSVAQWVAEDGSLTETDASFDDVSLSPKTVGAMTSYSRRTLINAVPAIEQMVRKDLSSVIAAAIDGKAMLGTGTANTPKGIVNVVGISDVSLATLSWENVLAFAASIANADALGGSLGFAMNHHAVKKFRSTLKESGLPGYLMENASSLADYAVATTTALPGDGANSPATPATVIFGDWSSLLIGYWSGTDILINPYETTAYAKGRVMVRVMRDCDVQVRHAESFAVADDLVV